MSSEEELDYDEDDVEEEIEDAPVEQKKRKTAKKGGGKKIKDPNKPKRNMTAFFLYSNANRAKIKAEYPEATFGELVSAPSSFHACCVRLRAFTACHVNRDITAMGNRCCESCLLKA